MRLNIFLAFLFVVVGASAAVRPVSMSTTNGQAVGTTTIGGRILATNTVANGGTNHFAGTINSATNISSQGIFLGNGAGVSNVPAPLLTGIVPVNSVIVTSLSTNGHFFEVNVLQFGASTALGDNSVAFQNCFNFAMKAGVTGSNVCVVIPPGTFQFTSPILLTNCRSMVIRGSGMNNTKLYASYAGPVLRTDGFWYSSISDLQFVAGVGHSGALVEIDGNRAGDASTFGVQGNKFENILLVGSSVVKDGLSFCTVGGSAAQGSENLFLNVHLQGFTNSGLHIYGYNAIGNNYIGGNVQLCTQYGILCEYGGINVSGISMQNATGGLGTQTGYDIAYLSGGGNPICTVENIISESLRGVYSASPIRAVTVRNYTLYNQAPVWAASTAYSLSNLVEVTITNSTGYNVYAFRVTAAGTSSNTTPVWTVGTVQDGPVTWSVYNEFSHYGVRELAFSKVPYGRVSSDAYAGYIHDNLFSRQDAVDLSQFYTLFGYAPKVARNKVYYFGADARNGLANTVNFNSYETLEFNQPVLWPYGVDAVLAPIVGIIRNDGFPGSADDAASISRNVLGVMGTLGKPYTNGVGTPLRIQGGLGTSAAGGGAVEIYTQPAGSTNSILRVLVSPDGKVGIGTTNPVKTLDVQSSSATFLLRSTTGTSSAFLSIENTGGSTYFGRDNSDGSFFYAVPYATILNAGGTQPILIGHPAAAELAILSGGNVGIGTTGPLNKLDVAGGAVFGSAYAGIVTAGDGNVMVTGNVSIGTTTPAAKLDVAGNIRASTTIYATGNVASISGVFHGNGVGLTNLPYILYTNGSGTNTTFYGPLTVADYLYATNTGRTNVIAGKLIGLGGIAATGGWASGLNNQIGQYGFATGIGNISVGSGSLVLGSSNTVFSGSPYSLVGGYKNSTSGAQNFSVGYGNVVDGSNSVAMGFDIGFDSLCNGSFGIGRNIDILSSASNTFVFNTDSAGFSTTRSNAFVVNATAGSFFTGGPITGNGAGLTGVPVAGITGIRHGTSGEMVLGSVTVTDTGCTANTRYFFSAHTLGTITNPGGYWASTRTASTSFVITSSQATETSTIDWMAIEP